MRLIGSIAICYLAWNAGAATASTSPSIDPARRWLAQRTVPVGILKRAERVRITARLAISPAGRVEGCEIIEPGKYPALNEYACAFYRGHGRFYPARDSEDRPAAGTFDMSNVWEATDTATDAATSKAKPPRPASNVGMWVTTDDLPKGLLRPDQSVVSSLFVTVSAKGEITSCDSSPPGEIPALDQYACQLILARGRYTPARDAAGDPVESVDWHRVRWQVPKD